MCTTRIILFLKPLHDYHNPLDTHANIKKEQQLFKKKAYPYPMKTIPIYPLTNPIKLKINLEKKNPGIFTGVPVCVEAWGACPPEDVGCPWGNYDLLEIILNKKHLEHKEFREWTGLSPQQKYDSEFVDLAFINDNLARIQDIS